jgi:hypothetical protein
MSGTSLLESVFRVVGCVIRARGMEGILIAAATERKGRTVSSRKSSGGQDFPSIDSAILLRLSAGYFLLTLTTTGRFLRRIGLFAFREERRLS